MGTKRTPYIVSSHRLIRKRFTGPAYGCSEFRGNRIDRFRILVDLTDDDDAVVVGIDLVECPVKQIKRIAFVFFVPVCADQVSGDGADEHAEWSTDDADCHSD